MKKVYYINRKTGQKEEEKVYFEEAIHFLYGKSIFSRTVGRFLLHTLAKWPFCSWLYGVFQARPRSKKKVLPFIEQYGVDTSEFLERPEDFRSFNDFFVRKLKPEARLNFPDERVVQAPADGRYLVYENVTGSDIFSVKGQQLSLQTLFQDTEMAKRYENASLVIARLCPTDCHRFYFPFDCVAGQSRLINGKLFSVNPIAIKDNPWIYLANRRVCTLLESKIFGKVAFFEVGATNVGSIIQTYTPGTPQKRGDEKGYFAFGSALLMLFEKGKVTFDEDLLKATKEGFETRLLIGESIGKATEFLA